MKIRNLWFLFFISANCLLSQNDSIIFSFDNFDFKFLTYKPEKRPDVKKEDYERGKFILDEVHRQAEADNLVFNCADYWNITMAFYKLGEPKKHIEVAFQKAVDANSDSICEYLEAFGEKSVKRLTESIPEVFIPFYQNCGQAKPVKKEFDSDEYAEENKFDKNLVKLMRQISENDQKYRKQKPVDWSEQTPLDEKNMFLIDSLFEKYGQYIGRSLVGKELEVTMWAVIQHSTIEKMEAYLPIVHEAVKKEELHPTPLKMLLDRIYCTRYNYQFFGSQFGGDCELAVEKKRMEIREKYGLK